LKIYLPQERPDVEVLVDGAWYPGELRGTWRRRCRRQYTVSFRRTPGLSRLDTVTGDRVRMTDTTGGSALQRRPAHVG
jgi:hypothetical protein